MIKRWLKPLLDHNANIRERTFRLLTGIGIVAILLMLICGVIVGDSILDQAMKAGSIVYMSMVLWLSMKTHRVNTGATWITLLLIVVFPINFFLSDGVYGGAPIWFIFSFVYISVTIWGKRKAVFLALNTAVTILSYYVAYHYPKYVRPYTVRNAYINSVTTVIMIGALISAMIIFQNLIYEEENKISEQQKKEIEKLSQSEKRFFASMSHEIRTPINTIIGLNEMILRSDVSDEVAENARNIQGASKMLLTLINDILDVSKMESGKMDIVNVSYETGVFFSDIINIIWVKAKEKGLEFHLNIDSSMPSMLCGDEVRIKQVLINILNNSIKYTSKGSVTLSVKCERISVNRVRVYYNITDTGMGIKKESIPHLFDAFQRVDEEKNRYIEGTGLGLSIVKQLVDLMEGEITVNSVYTQGTTFLVALEQDIIDEKMLGQFSLESHVNTGERPRYKQSFEAPEAHILIVDDNEMNLMVATKLLSDTKIQIDTAMSGEECLRLTQTKRYDGILMDHLMPEMDGIECLHALREQQGGKSNDVPVIALTANAGSESQLLYKKEGFSGYLAKPVNGMLLEAAVMNMLPKELIVMSEDKPMTEIGKDVLIFDHQQRMPIAITTDSMSDIPKELIEKYGISIQPYYICTQEGRFLDGKELEADDLISYIMGGKKGYSSWPEVEDYEKFFAGKLTKAQNVIHITMAKKVSEAYRTASEAAKSFENVTIIDSGQISSGIGLLVLTAAYMAKN
ncbi:MAG: response regulator, partial [Lachnospiraceae bacterium]|nr:response regulator [Lachnospiraceae bacterium]